MTLLHSLILGIVEGFTEFLPISSTAHIALISELMRLDQTAFVKTFEIAIQSGAILAVIVLYWRKFLNIEILKKIIVAFIPTAIIGFMLYKLIKTYLLGNVSVMLWALAIGGVLLILFEKFWSKKITESVTDVSSLSYKKAAVIGVIQSLAVIPGVSRSAATIIGGLFLGMGRAAVVEFSFLLAVPTILAATAYDVYKNVSAFSSADISSLSVGFIAAFVTALIGIKFLLKYLRTKNFTGFGIYRIAIVIIFIVIISLY